MTVEAPLNSGQLYSWREVDSYPPGWRAEANLPATWDLRGHSLEAVTDALTRLAGRHEALRTSFEISDGEPVQLVHPSAAPAISRADRVITDFAEPERTTGRLLAAAFPMTGGLCWRAELVTTAGSPMYLSMAFSHLIVDVWSIQELRQRFYALLSGADPDPGPSPRQLAERQRQAAASGRGGASERYWRRMLADDTALRLPTLPDRAEKPRIQATLHSHQLGFLVAQAARLQCVTAPAVVAGLVAAGLAHATGTGSVQLDLMSSNRFSHETEHVVGTMNQLIPVAVTADPDDTLAAHLNRVHWSAARAYRYSSYDVDRVAALAAEVRGAPAGFNTLFPSWFNYLPLDDVAAPAGSAEPAELVWTPSARGYGQPFDVRVTVQNGRTSVALRTDPDVLDATALTGLLRLVAAGALAAVTDPEVPLGTLWDDSAALPLNLFQTEALEAVAS